MEIKLIWPFHKEEKFLNETYAWEVADVDKEIERMLNDCDRDCRQALSRTEDPEKQARIIAAFEELKEKNREGWEETRFTILSLIETLRYKRQKQQLLLWAAVMFGVTALIKFA